MNSQDDSSYSDDQIIDNVHAWGNKQAVFYKQNQIQYQKIQDQIDQAQKIKQNLTDLLIEDDFFTLKTQKQLNNSQVLKQIQNRLIIQEIQKTKQSLLTLTNLKSEAMDFPKIQNDIQTMKNIFEQYKDNLNIYLGKINKTLPKTHSIYTKLGNLKLKINACQGYQKFFRKKLKSQIKLKSKEVEIKEKINHQKKLKQQKKKKKKKNFNQKTSNNSNQNSQLCDISSESSEMYLIRHGNKKLQQSVDDEQNSENNQQIDIDFQQQNSDLQLGKNIYEQQVIKYKKIKQQKEKKKLLNKQKKNEQLKKKFVMQKVQQNQPRRISEAILYKKGLYRIRNKMYKNPRIKHKLKYAKAIKKIKKIHPIRKPQTNYKGQAALRVGIIKSIPIK